jgi:hypothetical protein
MAKPSNPSTSEPLSFVIPTYRLREVGATVAEYDEHFWRNGHSVPIIVFDDSSMANHEKYYALLEATATHNELFYVGPREKEQFIAHLNQRLPDKRVQGLVKSLFRPSYGGNRNYTLMYTLGGLVVSADDDMRPYTLMEHSPESLESDEICRGRLHRAQENGYGRKSFDILTAFQDVLGKAVSEVPDNYDRGELIVDTAMDLETNATNGLRRENSLLVRRGPLPEDALVKIAQTFRSGTGDIDAIDFVDMFLDNEEQIDPTELNETYVLENFRPAVTKRNWRMDCGVAGYDNTFGLPPFFPTRLRCEDYIYRLWVQQPGLAAAHVDAAQNHCKSNYMRHPPVAEILNEEISNLLKRKIKDSLSRLDELGIVFDYDGEVAARDAEEILEKIQVLHSRALRAAQTASNPARETALKLFAADLHKAFYGFEPDFFQHDLLRIVDDVVSVIKGSIELWPTLVEICYFQKGRRGLPMARVNNRRRQASAEAEAGGGTSSHLANIRSAKLLQ